MAVDPARFDEVAAQIHKKYANIIRSGDDYQHPPRISTRSLALDVAMGGGIPVGRISRFYGNYSSTKTLNSWNIIAEAQKMGMTCCYWNIEKAYDKKFVEYFAGVDTKALKIAEVSGIEEVGDALEALLSVAHLHVIDSCSAAVSDDEVNADINEWRPGIAARAWGKAMRRINKQFDQGENVIVMIDQVRVNFKTGSEDAAGGKILDHASSMSVKFKKHGWLYKNKEGWLDPKAKQTKSVMNDQTEPDGMEIKARVEKSRVGRPLIPATMRLDFETKQFDRTYELVEAAKAYEVVENRGGGNYYYPAVPQKGKKQQRLYGEAALREFVEENKMLQKTIRNKAIQAAASR